MNPYPPFGSDHPASSPPIVSLFVGDDVWNRAAAHAFANGANATLVLPQGSDSEDFFWPVEGRTVKVFWPNCTAAQMQKLAMVLFAFDAHTVVGNVEDQLFYKSIEGDWL